MIRYYANQHLVCTVGTASATFTFNWTDGSAGRSFTTPSLTLGTMQSATTGHIEGVIPITVASGAISFTSSFTGCTGAASYDIATSAEQQQ